MENQQRIKTAYAEAVSGMQEHWFVNQPLNWYAYVAALPKHLQVTYVIVILHKQVINGGFDQYFANGYGVLFAELAAAAFAEIGAVKEAALVKEAIKALRHAARLLTLDWNISTLQISEVISLLKVPDVENTLDRLTDEYCMVDPDLGLLLGGYLQRH